MSEAIIRDLLASDLSVIERGLQLLDVEKFIPSEIGTRCFLDLLAKDDKGHWVIIEVKKTNAAAREAAHEIFKYAEAVKRHFGARNDEIRVIVASSEWKELLLPFSRLKSETDINVEGVQIVLDTSGQRLSCARIESVPIDQGRYLAPWHEINLYRDKESLDHGISSYDESCLEKGIKDYVLVVLKAAEDYNKRAEESLATSLKMIEAAFNEQMFGEGGDLNEVALDKYEYMLYFAPQILSKEFCLGILARFPERLEEVVEFTSEMSEEEELCTLHENVYDLEPKPFRDWFEIGYAAKLKTKLLEDERWEVVRILRRGAFARNELLGDDAIMSELEGGTGSSGQGFKRTISLANRAHIASAKKDLGTALATNPSWLAHIYREIDEASRAHPEGSLEINVFCPSAGLFTIYFMATSEDSLSYMPHYAVSVVDADGNHVTSYIGLLAPIGQPVSLIKILEKYYEGRIEGLMFLASAGFYETRDADILDDLGLGYRSFRIEGSDGFGEWFELKDERWKSFKPTLPFQPLQPYFDRHGSLINSIVREIGSRMLGGIHLIS
jgi:hypothetical protein